MIHACRLPQYPVIALDTDNVMPDEPPTTSATPPEPVALDLRDHVVFDPNDPPVLPIARTGQLDLELICLEPKQAFSAITLDADRLYTVIGGRAWAVIEDAEITLEPLQAVLVPSGMAHGIRNDSPDPLILQVVTSPPGRESRSARPQRASTRQPEGGDDRPRFSRVRRFLGSG